MGESARFDEEVQEVGAEREAPAKVVYLRPAISLGRGLTRDGDRWRVRVGTSELRVAADPSVDSGLLEDAAARGAPVVLDGAGEEALIVGVLMTQRALTIDDDGVIDAEVRRLRIHAREGVLLKTARSFVELKPEQVELFARRVLTRARDVAKTLAAVIELN